MTQPPTPSIDQPSHDSATFREALRLEFDVFVMERLAEGWGESELAQAIEQMVKSDAVARAAARTEEDWAMPDPAAAVDTQAPVSDLPPVPSGWPCFLAGALMVGVLALALFAVWP